MAKFFNDGIRSSRFVWKAIRVRLRFVLLLGGVFLLVGQWERMRSAFDMAWARVSGISAADQSVAANVEFFCPMDPGVISDWPSICPICNMALVKRKKGEMGTTPDGVVARMQFSPYRVQLAGIQTTPVQLKSLVYVIDAAGELADGNQKDAKKLNLEVSLPARYAYLKWGGRTCQITSREVAGIEPLTATVVNQVATTLQLEVNNPDELFRSGVWANAQFKIPFSDLEPFRSRREYAKSDQKLLNLGSTDQKPKFHDQDNGAIPKTKVSTPQILTIPENAVVDFGSRRIVYVETDPGTFDGREVVLGPRCDSEYPVLSGLTAGQLVAMTGAFLIDSEARLNPSLAAGYFGASQRITPAAPVSNAVPVPLAAVEKPIPQKVRLSKEDTALVRRQRICPVTGLPLDSMGGPKPMVVKGRRVFICCEGCESRLKKEPEKYLAKLPQP